MLDVAFNTAVSGLRIAQRSLATTSNNIANLHTPGFTKKVATQTTLAPGGQGQGVLAGPVRRIFDEGLQRELMRRISQQSELDTRATHLRRIEEVQGSPDAGTNISARLGALRNAFVELGNTPESIVLQRSAIIAAEDFAYTMNQVSAAVLAARNAVQGDLGRVVEEINTLLTQIDAVDAEITRRTLAATGAPELEDKRDAAVGRLAELVEVKTLRREDGSMLVMTTSGLTLFDRGPNQLDMTPSQLDHNSFYRFSPPGTIAPITIGSGSTIRDVTGQLSGGRIGGLLGLRDQELPRMQAELDTLAFQAAVRMQANGLTLFTRADGVSLPGNIPSTQVGFAAEIRIADRVMHDPRLMSLGDAGLSVLPAPTADVPNPPFPLALGAAQVKRIVDFVFESAGGSSMAPHQPFATRGLGPDPLANLSTTMPSSARLLDYASQLVAKHSGERARVDADFKEIQGVRRALEDHFQDKVGVNLDDEMAHLQVLQRSYASSAQVLRTIERMINDLFAVR